MIDQKLWRVHVREEVLDSPVQFSSVGNLKKHGNEQYLVKAYYFRVNIATWAMALFFRAMLSGSKETKSAVIVMIYTEKLDLRL